MNKTLIGSFVGLLLGAAVGGFAGYFYGKNKYLAIAEKEIDSVKKVYEKHFSYQAGLTRLTKYLHELNYINQ